MTPSRLALGLLAATLAADAVAQTPSQLILSAPDLSLGALTPEDPPDLPRGVELVTLLTDTPWNLQLLAGDFVSIDRGVSFPADHVLWRLRGDRFRPLAPNLPITLTTGMPSPTASTPVYLEFAILGDWSVPPGAYSGPLNILLSSTALPGAGQKPATLTSRVKLSFRVLPHAALHVVSTSLASPPVDPARGGRVAWEPLRVNVKANTEWILSAEPLDDFAADRASTRLPATVVSLAQAGGRRSLQRGGASLVGSGPATGNSGVDVVVTLDTQLTGAEGAGRYRLPVRLRVSPGGAGAPPTL
jgi:hypothetical protein